MKNKSKGQAQLESPIENGVQNQLISLNKDKNDLLCPTTLFHKSRRTSKSCLFLGINIQARQFNLTF